MQKLRVQLLLAQAQTVYLSIDDAPSEELTAGYEAAMLNSAGGVRDALENSFFQVEQIYSNGSPGSRYRRQKS